MSETIINMFILMSRYYQKVEIQTKNGGLDDFKGFFGEEGKNVIYIILNLATFFVTKKGNKFSSHFALRQI